MEKPICKHCGSDRVRRDAWTVWHVATQKWVANELFDIYFCCNCDGQCSSIEFIDAEPDDASMDPPTSKGHALAMILDVAGPCEGCEFESLPRRLRLQIVEVWNLCAKWFDPNEVNRALVQQGVVTLSGYRRLGVTPGHNNTHQARTLVS